MTKQQQKKNTPKNNTKKARIFTQEEIKSVLDSLEEMYPDADCELHFENLFQLIVAVVLSAQTTDKSVNRVTPDLFQKYPNAAALADAGRRAAEEQGLAEDEIIALSKEDLLELGIDAVSQIIHTLGMYRTKSRNLLKLARVLTDTYGGNVPDDYDKLVALPGVGRKTANVVLSVGFGHQRIAVDTHVFRVANRIGFAHAADVLATENALMEILPESRWSRTHHSLIFHGRYCCTARKPNCEQCKISQYCDYYKNTLQNHEES